MTIHQFPSNFSREKTLREVRIANIINALYLSEQEAEIMEAFLVVPSHLISQMRDMCQVILESREDQE